MSKIFFLADTHFGDETIIKYENRPFRHAREMDEEMIKRWNAVVAHEDEVYVLGDFGADGYEEEILSRLQGTKYLVKGNHDAKPNAQYREFGFSEVYDRPVIMENFWILSHDALYVNTNMPYANLFGHVHNHPMIKDYSSHHYCVSVERLNYTPIDFEVIKKKVREA